MRSRAARTAGSAPDRRTQACPCHQAAADSGSGLGRPLVEGCDRGGRRQLEAQGCLGARPRQHLERHLGDDAEDARASRTAGARHRSRRRSSSPGRRSAARSPLPRRAGAYPARSRAPRRRTCAAARRGPRRSRRRASDRRPKAGRLEGQELATLGQRAPRSRDSGVPQRARDHELGGLVVDDAAVGSASSSTSPASALAVEVLGARAPQAQRAARCGAAASTRSRSFSESVPGALMPLRSAAGRDGAGRRGARASCRTRRSARSVGIALPGFSRPAGSKASLTRKEAARSAAENCTHIELIFSSPTPCSPVMVPPSSTHSSRISAPKRSARSHQPGSLASNRITGCRLPSPAWNTFMQRRP